MDIGAVAHLTAQCSEIFKKIHIPYACHYNPRFVYFFTPFFPAVYIEERFILQTIYVLKTEILHFFKTKIRGLYTRAVTDQERVIVARVRYVLCSIIEITKN